MRVLLTAESFLPYLSGVTVSVDSLARGLGARGHEVLVLAPRPDAARDPGSAGSPGPTPRYAWLPSYQLPRVAPPAYRMPWPLPWTAAVREARAFAPDIVHAHSPFVTGVIARRIARGSGAPLVFTHHTRFDDYGHYLGPLAGPGAALTEAYLRRFWAGCGAVIAPSGDLAAEIADRLPARRRSRIHVIPTGVDVAGIQATTPVDVRPAAGWREEALIVVSLGRLAPEKSPMTVLDAFALAAKRDERLRLVVIGGGPSEDALRRRAGRPDLAGRVAFTGLLPRSAALARLRGGDLFVFASRTETQGLVLAEALSAGLPSIAVDGPGVRDSVRDGIDGVVIPAMPEADRAERLATAVIRIAGDDAARAAMTRRALEDAERFSVGQRVGETEALYRSLLG